MAVAQRILNIRKVADLRSDEALVKAAKGGQMEAASHLIERHYPRVYSFLSYLTGNRSTAEDLTQEVFTRALGALARFNGRYQFEPWLLRIARNLVIDESRRDLRRASPMEHDQLIEHEPSIKKIDHVWESIDSLAAASLVKQALSKMPMRQRTVLILREIEGLSYTEIAQIIDTNERGVEGTLRRARARFRLEAAEAESEDGRRAVCQRTLRLVATEGKTIEATKHISRCERCRADARKVLGADGAFAALPPLTLGDTSWLGSLLGGKFSSGGRRGILETIRGTYNGSFSAVAQAAEVAAAVMVAATLSVSTIAGNTKKLTTTAAAAPVVVSAAAQAAPQDQPVTLEAAFAPASDEALIDSPSKRQTAPDDQAPPSRFQDLLLKANLPIDLMSPLDQIELPAAIALDLDRAIEGVSSLGDHLSSNLDLHIPASQAPALPVVPDVTSTVPPSVTLPRRRPYLG